MVPRSGLLGDVSALWPLLRHYSNWLNRLVYYATQVGQPFKLPEESHMICGRNKDIQGLKCGFRCFNGTTVFSSALSMKLTSSWCGSLEDGHNALIYRLRTEAIFKF
jgi:hypothetical protein